MVKIRSTQEIELMRESGRISAIALKKVLHSIKVGISGLELEDIAASEIRKNGGELAFPKEPGYKWATCITVNDEVVHGIPTGRVIQEGDVVSIDLGSISQGWFSDVAWTILVGSDSEKEQFLKAGEEALWNGIAQAVEGNKIGDIASAIQQCIEGSGYNVVRSLVGHGVGQKLHEDPEVPGFGKKGAGLILKSGMTLAVEVIYTKGSPDVVLERDGWTISTKDGSLSGLFEMTIVVGNRPEVLTNWKHV